MNIQIWYISYPIVWNITVSCFIPPGVNWTCLKCLKQLHFGVTDGVWNNLYKVWIFVIKVWKNCTVKFEGMKKIQGYENNFKDMKYFTKVWQTFLGVWKKVDFWKFPSSYPRVWEIVCFFHGPCHVSRSNYLYRDILSHLHWSNRS